VIVPAEARALTERAMNTELPKIEADWVKQPMAMTLAGIPLQTPEDHDRALADGEETDNELADYQEKMRKLKHRLLLRGKEAVNHEMNKLADELGVRIISVPEEVWKG